MADTKSVPDADDQYLRDLKRKFMRSQEICEPARKNWEADQDYYDGNQWTDQEKQILLSRKQPALVANETKASVNGVIGLIERGRTDPKAWGRTPNDSDSAEIATDCLRYVADEQRFQAIKSKGLKDYFVPGVVVAVVEIDQQREVVIRKGRPEEFFYDPYSRESDFMDARYKGLAKWMDEADALALTDDEKIRGFIRMSVDNNGLLANETHEDRPAGWAWADSKTRRVMVIEMYHRKGGEWWRTLFVSNAIIEDGRAPYVDDRGRSFCNLIAQSAYVDRQNQRYGIVRDLRGPQDGLNKTASKITHILNVAKLRVDPAVQDHDEVRAEWAKPDGIIVAKAEQVEEIGDRNLTPGHAQILEYWDSKMRRLSPTPAIIGRQTGGQSGRALLAEQQAGMTEMAGLLAQLNDWELRVYRAVWYCIKQFWTEPKYVRVTDDESAPKYILLNGPEPVTDENGQPVVDPMTGQPQMRMRTPAKMDVDIVLDTTPDTAVIQEEQFTKLAELWGMAVSAGQEPPFPFATLIKASSLPHKRMLLDEMKKPPQPTPQQQMAQELQLRGAVADVSEKEAGADLKRAQAVKTQQEAQMVGVEPQLRMAEHQQEMQMQREEFAQETMMRREDHAMDMEQTAQAGRIKAAEGVQNLRLKAVQGEQALQQKQAAFTQSQAQARQAARTKPKQKGRT